MHAPAVSTDEDDLARDEHIDELWTAYLTGRGRALRDQLTVRYAPLVKYVAGLVSGRVATHVELDDLISWGMVGLIEAISRFDPAHGTPFEGYARSRVRGAILDGLRGTDWAPRSVRRIARQFERATADLQSRLQRSPTEQEVAAELGLPVDEVRRFLGELPMANLVALDALLSPDAGVRLADTLASPDALDPQAALEEGEGRRLLARAVEHLPAAQRLVVGLYYLEGLTLVDIGRVLGASESWASYLRRRAVLHLRAELRDSMQPGSPTRRATTPGAA